jgi:ribose transport system permease protein
MNSLTRRLIDYTALILILAGLILLFGLLSDRFLTTATFSSIANRIPPLALLATGMTLVLISGGIDLSVGSVLALAGSVAGVLIGDHQWPLFAALSASLAVGILAGLANGGILVAFRVPSFIVTLGMLEIARGLSFWVADSRTKYLGASVEWVASPVAGLPVSPAFIVAIAVVAAGHILLTRTVLGRKITAVGTNETATRLAGIDPRPIKLITFALAGGLAGLAAICHIARLGASDPNAGTGMELSAIAAAVIGGTSLSGGRGSVLCTFLGVLIIATLEAGLAQAGVSEPVKRIVTGGVIVLAVIADGIRKRM